MHARTTELMAELREPLRIIANVAALCKKGCKSEPGNYGPAGLTSVICKIMETIYFRKKSRQAQLPRQSAVWIYISSLNCDTATEITRTQRTDALDKRQIDVSYCDFIKAFDRVPHHRLLNKLVPYGIEVQYIT